MTSPLDDLVNYRITRASETLDEAKLLFSEKHYEGSVNRLYYACFYAANALLLSSGLSSKKHSGVRALLHQHFVKTEKLSKELGNLYDTLYDFRERSDYEDLMRLDPLIAETNIPRVEAFLHAVEHIVKHIRSNT